MLNDRKEGHGKIRHIEYHKLNMQQMCPMGCLELDTPEHCLSCDPIYPKETRNYTKTYSVKLFQSNLMLPSYLPPSWRRGRMPVP